MDFVLHLKRRGFTEHGIKHELRQKGYLVSQSTVRRRLYAWGQQTCSPFPPGKRGRRKLLTPRDDRRIKQLMLAREAPSKEELKGTFEQMGKPVKGTTLYKSLASNPYLSFKTVRKTMYLNKNHKRQRKQWAQQQQQAQVNWNRVMFTDEKLFFLHGPASRSRKWQDVRLPPVRIPTKGLKGNAVNVWGGFSAGVVPDLCCIDTHFTSDSFCEALTDTLLPVMPVKQYTVYLDRHPAHKSAYTQEWLRQNRVQTELLPPKGADLNPMETLWAVLTRKVYGQTKVFAHTSFLIREIRRAWLAIKGNRRLRMNLVHEMPDRLHAVVASKGDETKY